MSVGGVSTAGFPVGYEPVKPEQNKSSGDFFTKEDCRNAIQEYKEKIFTKIKNGDTESAYQIGSQSLTEKEWDELLEKFDLAQAAFSKSIREKIARKNETQEDAVNIIQEMQKVEAEAAAQEPQKTEAAAQEPQKTESISDVQMDMLFTDTVPARYPLQEVDEEGNPKEDLYLIAIDKNGIRCSKAGSDGYEWQIIFTDDSQYQKTIEFMDWADDYMDNFWFSCHDNFWEDYLNGNMDEEAFKKFLEGTNNGIPDYSYTIGDSMYIDEEKAQWAKYMNNPSWFTVLSKEELLQSVDQNLEENHQKLEENIEMYGKAVDMKAFEQMLKETCIGWSKATFKFEGESKAFSFDEFVKEWENRYSA